MGSAYAGAEREEQFRLVKQAAGVRLARCRRRFRFTWTTYTPDFYAPSELTYYEVIGSRQRLEQLRPKLDLMALVYPQVLLQVVHPDGRPVTLHYVPVSQARLVPKDRGAVRLGKMGGKARALALTPDRRRAIATHAALTRWAKRPKPTV